MSINRSIADLLRSHSTIPTAAAPGENLLINGAFTVAQRGTSFAITPNASGRDHDYTLDRWELDAYLVDSDYTVTRETLTPGTDEPYDHGFRHSLKVNCDVADASPAGSDLLALAQKLEGQNVQALAYGDAQAKASTVSFWHKHTKTGTHCVTVEISGGSKWTSKQYTQTTTNTWEFATVTIPANTANIPANTTSAALDIMFGISVGSDYTAGAEAAWGSVNGNYFPGQVNNMDDVANNFEIAGVKWELGSSATTFLHENYGDTLHHCQRYFERRYWADAADIIAHGASTYNQTSAAAVHFQQEMRTSPTITLNTASTYRFVDQTNTVTAASGHSSGAISPTTFVLNLTHGSNPTQGGGYMTAVSATFIEINAEL